MCASTQTPTERLATLVQSLSETELCDLIARLPVPALRVLERRFLAGGCNCRLPKAIKDDSLAGAIQCRCEHTIDRGQWTLPFAALKLLLLRLQPEDYADPPPPALPSFAWDPAAKVGVYMERHRHDRGLRHPDDFDAARARHHDVARPVSCDDHGSGWGRLEIGDVHAETCGQGDEEEEDFRDEVKADRLAWLKAQAEA